MDKPPGMFVTAYHPAKDASTEVTRPMYIRSRPLPAPPFHPTHIARANSVDTKGVFLLPRHEGPCSLPPVHNHRTRNRYEQVTNTNMLRASGSSHSVRYDEEKSDNFSHGQVPSESRRMEATPQSLTTSNRVLDLPPCSRSNTLRYTSPTSSTCPTWIEAAVASDHASPEPCARHRKRSRRSLNDSTAPLEICEKFTTPGDPADGPPRVQKLDTLDGTSESQARDIGPTDRPDWVQPCLVPDSSATVATHFGTIQHDPPRSSVSSGERRGHAARFLDPFSNVRAGIDRQVSDLSEDASYIRPNAFAGHRDTLARLRFLNHHATSLPPVIIDGILRYTSFDDYKNMRLVSRSWLEQLPEPKLRSLPPLPAEILQEIFALLQPCDFDAARHTCKSWFLASLDRQLGRSMLKKAGCYTAFLADQDHREDLLCGRYDTDSQVMDADTEHAEQTESEEWLISRRLATESRLSAAWHGSGLEHDTFANTRFTIRDTISLGDAAECPTLTVSSCGKFLLVTRDCTILVYAFASGKQPLEPIAKLVADSKILAVCMDASSDRYAVAALVVGHIGVCWDMSDMTSFMNGTAALDIQRSPSQVYSNIGSANDPPRSVAICPQRNCVAFGRKSGIELRWIDAATGASYGRWFPLAAPSDHLYFLPSKSSFDSTKRLRLMSSATNPALQSIKQQGTQRPDWSCVTSLTSHGRKRSMTRLFYGNLPFVQEEVAQDVSDDGYDSRSDDTITQDAGCDHYQAVPLSDGIHMLFTDPVTGFLCLGSDAPLGGPTKFIRKVCMVPPSKGADIPSSPPVRYTAARDLRWGVHVVASYADGSIVFYNIPSDCFERIRHVRTSSDVWDDFAGVFGESDLLMDFFMQTGPNSEDGQASTSSFKSVLIDGARICQIDADVDDLVVDSSNGGCQVWMFHEGQATRMNIFAPKNSSSRSFSVGTDGLLQQQSDEGDETNHDLEMRTPRIRFLGLDGCCDNAAMCGPVEYDYEYGSNGSLHPDEGISMTPPELDSDDGGDDGLPQQIELLTDWCRESLLRPYIITVPDIQHH